MIIEVRDLWKRYGRFDALNGLEFAVPEGSAFALVGVNGAGKTTTIKILVNLLQASRGTASILGVDTRAISPRELGQIGYVSENQELPGRLTVGEYLDYLRPFYPRWDRALETSIRHDLVTAFQPTEHFVRRVVIPGVRLLDWESQAAAALR